MITKIELVAAREKVMEKFGAFLKAEEELVSELNGFFDKKLFDNYTKARKEFYSEENKWMELFKNFLFEQKIKEQ